jgi:hypothetical protein
VLESGFFANRSRLKLQPFFYREKIFGKIFSFPLTYLAVGATLTLVIRLIKTEARFFSCLLP